MDTELTVLAVLATVLVLIVLASSETMQRIERDLDLEDSRLEI